MRPEDQAQPPLSDGQISGHVKGSTFSDHESDATSQAPEGGGMGGYGVSLEAQDASLEFAIDLV